MTSFASNKNKANFSDPMGIAAEAARLLSPQAEHNKCANDLLELAHNVENNMESGGANELEEGARRMFANLPSEILGKVQNAISLLLQRAENSSLQSLFTPDFWNKLKEETEKEQRAEFLRADFAFDATNGSGQNAINQNDYSRTYTHDELDAMEWKGNENEIWNIGGINISRKDAFDAGKKAHDKWNKSADAKAMSPEDKAKADLQWSQYLQAIKNNDPTLAAKIYNEMPPSMKAHIDEENARKIATGFNVELQTTARTETVQKSTAETTQLFKSAVNTNQGTENFDMPPTAVETGAVKRPLVLVNHFGKVNGSQDSELSAPAITANAATIYEQPVNQQLAENVISAPASPPVLGGFKRG